jgi:hypothetical protein
VNICGERFHLKPGRAGGVTAGLKKLKVAYRAAVDAHIHAADADRTAVKSFHALGHLRDHARGMQVMPDK